MISCKSGGLKTAIHLVSGLIVGLHVHQVLADKLDADHLLDPDRITEIRIELPPSDWNNLRRQAPKANVFMGAGSGGSNYSYFKGNIWIERSKD